MSVRPAMRQAAPRPPTRRRPPSRITAPSAGATVSGAVTVSATASDAGTVAGVQFKLDGRESRSGGHVRALLGGLEHGGRLERPALAHRDGARRGRQSSTSAAVAVTVSNVTPTGLVAAYGFGEGTGTSTADASGSGNTARSAVQAGQPPATRQCPLVRRRQRLGHGSRRRVPGSDERNDARGVGVPNRAWHLVANGRLQGAGGQPRLRPVCEPPDDSAEQPGLRGGRDPRRGRHGGACR